MKVTWTTAVVLVLCALVGLVLTPACDQLGLGGSGGSGGSTPLGGSACMNRCYAAWDAAMSACAEIASDTDRKACQDGADAALAQCLTVCDSVGASGCREDCEAQAETCEAGCRKLPKDDKKGRQQCWQKCNDEYAKCIKKC